MELLEIPSILIFDLFFLLKSEQYASISEYIVLIINLCLLNAAM